MIHRSKETTAANFDRLTRFYRALELVAFGRDLERVRFRYVDRLQDCDSILILGDGDGRFLAELVQHSHATAIHSIDASPAMLAAASARLPAAERERVTFTCADALAYDFGPRSYDAVVTLFFLDCFSTPQVGALVDRIIPRLRDHAIWVFGDFVMPTRGWARLRARCWLAVLYTFFRWETGIQVNTLPESAIALEHAGFVLDESVTFQHQLLRAAVYRRE